MAPVDDIDGAPPEREQGERELDIAYARHQRIGLKFLARKVGDTTRDLCKHAIATGMSIGEVHCAEPVKTDQHRVDVAIFVLRKP